MARVFTPHRMQIDTDSRWQKADTAGHAQSRVLSRLDARNPNPQAHGEKFLSKLNQRTFESGMNVDAPRGMVEELGWALDGGE